MGIRASIRLTSKFHGDSTSRDVFEAGVSVKGSDSQKSIVLMYDVCTDVWLWRIILRDCNVSLIYALWFHFKSISTGDILY